MKPPLWSENLDRLRDSLIAQANRIRAGSPHSTIKGTSLEVVLRRTLREYVPGYFTIGSGQAANNTHGVSPQLDVIVYDQNVFPHLAVNEDSSVLVCCESLLSAVECKAAWAHDERLEKHFRKFAEVESKRHSNYSDPSNAAAYFVVVFDPVELVPESLSAFEDDSRAIGMYTVEGNKSWYSPQGQKGFSERQGNALALLLQDVLFDCMSKGQKDLGTFGLAHEVVLTYFGENANK